ncbi:hypothetical protein IFM89_005613 [Coptis chinensis]|uniref:Myb/SANT-like domain-containing protein n=1 Tax=Coptis chinensis TaxID=261450 RepID=A0A835HU52_9MAGN|nr:hypothetical protein IFM89_005613 [Coptis chinensis]
MVDMLHEMVTLDTASANGKQDSASENALDTLQTGVDAVDACSGSCSRTYWQQPMDSYFIELMLEQVHQGNQFDGTFRKHAWIHMTELFIAKFGYKYDRAVLKNCYKTLKRQYTTLKVLLDQKGWVHPDAKPYFTRPLPHFHLSVIFKDVTVDEGYSDSAYNVDEQNENKDDFYKFYEDFSQNLRIGID